MAGLADFGQLAIITWHDCHSDQPGWLMISELEQEATVVHTVGWIIPTEQGGCPDHVTLYQTRIEGTDQVDSVVHIPVSMVQQVKLINR